MTDFMPFIGEPLALDLINTRFQTSAGPVDLLGTSDGLKAWLALEADRLAGFNGEEAAKLAETDLKAIHAVRTWAALAIDHVRRGEPPPQSALRGLNQARHAAPLLRELSWDGASVADASRRIGPFAARLAAHFAEATAELLCHPAVKTVRKCEAEDCIMLFLPTNPRRRWCLASRCGNRVRVARYYQRHKVP